MIARRTFGGVMALGAMWALLAVEASTHQHAGGLLAMGTLGMAVAFLVGKWVLPAGVPHGA